MLYIRTCRDRSKSLKQPRLDWLRVKLLRALSITTSFSYPPPILCIFLLLLLLLHHVSLLLCFFFPLLINYACLLQLTEWCTAALSALNLLLSHFLISLLASQSCRFSFSFFHLSPSIFLRFLPLLRAHKQKLNSASPSSQLCTAPVSLGPALLSQSSLQLNSTPEASLQYSASYHSNQTLALSDSIAAAATPQRGGQVGGAVHSYNQVGKSCSMQIKVTLLE